MSINVFNIVGISFFLFEMKFPRDIVEFYDFIFYTFAGDSDGCGETSDNTIDAVVLTYEFDIHRERFFTN